MTDHTHPEPIKIPLTCDIQDGKYVYWSEITPDLARQIVALAGIPRLDVDFILDAEQRIAALEEQMREHVHMYSDESGQFRTSEATGQCFDRPPEPAQPAQPGAGDEAAEDKCILALDLLSRVAQRMGRDAMVDEEDIDPVVEAHGAACGVVRDTIARLRAELEQARVALGGFQEGPFEGTGLVNGIQALSMRCAAAERELEQARRDLTTATAQRDAAREAALDKDKAAVAQRAAANEQIATMCNTIAHREHELEQARRERDEAKKTAVFAVEDFKNTILAHRDAAIARAEKAERERDAVAEAARGCTYHAGDCPSGYGGSDACNCGIDKLIAALADLDKP